MDIGFADRSKIQLVHDRNRIDNKTEYTFDCFSLICFELKMHIIIYENNSSGVTTERGYILQ